MKDNSWIEEFAGVYPYAGGSGTNGIATSDDAEFYRDYSGVTSKNQRTALKYLARMKRRGVVYHELLEHAGLTGTQANSALAQLHKSHVIVRLNARRRRCFIYVLHAYQDGREEQPYEPQAVHLSTEEGIRRAAQLAIFLRDRREFGQTPKSGDKEVAYALDYTVAVSRRKQESKRLAKERAEQAKRDKAATRR